MDRKEAIKIVKSNLPDSSFTMLREALETLIPELVENEDYDEKVRKNCIHFLKLQKSHHPAILEIEDCIAWLEKQGEYSDFCNKIQIGDKVTRNKDGVLVNLSQLERVAKTKDKNTNEKNTNEEKAQEIVSKRWKWIADFIEKNNLSKDDRNQIRFEMYGAILDMAQWKDERINDKLIALAMWMYERGFFKDDLQCDIEHQVMTFVELQNRKSEEEKRDVSEVKNENGTTYNPDEEMAKAIAHNDSLFDEENQSVSEQCEISAMEMAKWKNKQFDKKLRGYFWAHIVPNGEYNLEFADDFIRFDKEKRKAVDEIIKQFNEFKDE